MTMQAPGLRAGVLVLVAAGLVAPIGAGLWQTASAAFGHLPVLGAIGPDLTAWTALTSLPGLWTALRLTLTTGLGATALSLLIAIGVCAALSARAHRNWLSRVLTPFLALPHAALAIGLAFVLAPSGWIARLLATPLGWDRPPDVATVNDPLGLALMVGLMVKEVPFLLLVLQAALTQLPVRSLMSAGRSLGYARGTVWVRVILPQAWPLIRLPVLVVLAYAMSVVDMALILGPSNPPTLAVLVTRLFSDPDLKMLLPASAGGMLQLALVAGAFGLLVLGERAAAALGRVWLRRGGRGALLEPALRALAVAAAALLALGAAAMLALLVWSVAWRWPWPALVPQDWSLRAWTAPTAGWAGPLRQTTLIAVVATGVSLALAIAWLEAEDRARRPRARWAEALIYLPLLVPQVSFLFGLNLLYLALGVGGGVGAVVWAHVLFVFPYVMIALSDPWRALDPRILRTAAALGAGPSRRLWRVKLPMLLAPLSTAAAIGVAVSVAQYLPTLFIGAGRVATLTTEALTLASSSDRRVTAVYATLQAGLPFAAYALAFGLPAWHHRHRRDLRDLRPDPTP